MKDDRLRELKEELYAQGIPGNVPMRVVLENDELESILKRLDAAELLIRTLRSSDLYNERWNDWQRRMGHNPELLEKARREAMAEQEAYLRKAHRPRKLIEYIERLFIKRWFKQ